MKNTTENLKPEHIYLNLAECSEQERKEVGFILPFNAIKTLVNCLKKGKLYRNFKHLQLTKNNYWTVSNAKFNKTEVNFQQFKQIIEWKEVLQVDIFDIDFGGNVMARMEIKNGKFKFTDAMNGGGYSIAIEDIKITPTN